MREAQSTVDLKMADTVVDLKDLMTILVGVVLPPHFDHPNYAEVSRHFQEAKQLIDQWKEPDAD